jgi:ribosome-associated protein
MTKQLLSSKRLSDVAIKGLEEIKGLEIVRMDLRKLESAVTDFFVIATGTSDRHIQALGDSVMDIIKKEAGEKPINSEGLQSGEWVLLDYANVVIHIFNREKRGFYRLEDLWGDAKFEFVSEKEKA